MSPYDPSTWGPVTWALHVWAVYYLVQFFLHFFRFRRLEANVRAGKPGAVEAFNQSVRGFPAVGFAKMLDKRPLRDSEPQAAQAAGRDE